MNSVPNRDTAKRHAPTVMTDRDCVEFLQWALPKMRMRWPGFRKVRRQVCKRAARRMLTLGLPSLRGYRAHLEAHPEEWRSLRGSPPLSPWFTVQSRSPVQSILVKHVPTSNSRVVDIVET